MSEYQPQTNAERVHLTAKVFQGEVQVSTNAFQGGDSGHGGEHVIKLLCEDGMDIRFLGNTIVAGGDWELEFLRQAFTTVAELLNEAIAEKAKFLAGKVCG